MAGSRGEPRALVHGEAGEVGVVQHDLAGVGADQADDHVEGGGLAGAVVPQQADDFAGGHLQAQVFDHHATR